MQFFKNFGVDFTTDYFTIKSNEEVGKNNSEAVQKGNEVTDLKKKLN